MYHCTVRGAIGVGGRDDHVSERMWREQVLVLGKTIHRCFGKFSIKEEHKGNLMG